MGKRVQKKTLTHLKINLSLLLLVFLMSCNPKYDGHFNDMMRKWIHKCVYCFCYFGWCCRFSHIRIEIKSLIYDTLFISFFQMHFPYVIKSTEIDSIKLTPHFMFGYLLIYFQHKMNIHKKKTSIAWIELWWVIWPILKYIHSAAA